MGRKRSEKTAKLLPGVRERAGRWYWKPTEAKERAARKAKGEPVEVALGPAKSEQALKRWAEVSGYRTPEQKAKDGTVGELLDLYEAGGITKRLNGEPLSENTVAQYRWCLGPLRARFAPARYGKTEFEASRGLALGPAQIQRFVVEMGSVGSKCLAVLDNAFGYAIAQGRTVYNPCDQVVANARGRRDREPLVWEVECLEALASPVVALMMAFEAISAWRIRDILKLQRRHLEADGIRVRHGKGGLHRLWKWTPKARWIVAQAEKLPGHTPFPASAVFPRKRGKAYAYNGFYGAWQKLIADANAILAAGIVDPDTLTVAPGLSIDDLNFHDLRSKAHDDARAMGREGHKLLGNTPGVAKRHYARRAEEADFLE